MTGRTPVMEDGAIAWAVRDGGCYAFGHGTLVHCGGDRSVRARFCLRLLSSVMSHHVLFPPAIYVVDFEIKMASRTCHTSLVVSVSCENKLTPLNIFIQFLI
ncbi:hypothetical protein AVEN_137112-1 [Araneus ventricosus]|uniref:Uncharacterized protein n=1 Tax=Araneus ventricosus TaxID=182803 RepID=A0A4Y2GAE7_ARAVE|nr:hypothetical protein AVEN_137112-1 [Araneus ventricosus]